jgi:hypothetical protein
LGETHTLTADIAFQHCANAAAAAYGQAPAYITYHVATHVTVPSLGRNRTIERQVMLRTSDDAAILQDLPKGQRQRARGFPVSPTFDALSYFTLQWSANARMALTAYVKDVHPLTYANVSPTPQADVVVINLRYYHATYAADSSDAPNGRTHISMYPYEFLMRKAPKNALYFNDLYIDNTTGLPASVRFKGPTSTFSVEYGRIENHWLVGKAHYEETLFGPLHIGAMHIIADAIYDGFSFPSTPPDPQL